MAPAHLTTLADLAARHALALLLVISVLGLALARLAWHAIERLAPLLIPVGARLWHRVDRHRIAARVLGLQGAVSFIVAAAGAVGFIEVADAIDEDDDLAEFDVALAGALRQHLSADTLAVFSRITHLGDFAVLATGVAIGAIALWLGRKRWLASALVVATAGAALLNEMLKLAFVRTRPEFVHDLVRVHGHSFPSGHAAGSLAVYGFAAYIAVRLLPRAWHLPVTAAAMLMIVFVGASRVLLQVHYLSDVLAGWLGATTWTALCISAFESWRLSRQRRAAA